MRALRDVNVLIALLDENHTTWRLGRRCRPLPSPKEETGGSTGLIH